MNPITKGWHGYLFSLFKLPSGNDVMFLEQAHGVAQSAKGKIDNTGQRRI
jgi:hypothetical protein